MKRLILCLIAVLFLFSLAYAIEPAKITVDFKDADLRHVFRLISDIAKGDGMDIYIDPDIKGKITIKKINTHWNDILSEIGEKFHLMAAIKGNRLFIYPPSKHEILKKQFDFDTDMATPPSSGETEQKKKHFAAINKAHPDFKQIVDSGELEQWVENQPASSKDYYRKVYKEGTAEEVIKMVTEFKKSYLKKRGNQSNLPSDGRPIKLTLKNGNTMTWSNYSENGDQYCTQKSGGLFCISKNSVASITAKEEENPDAVVIVMKTSDAEKEASRNEFLDSRKKKECEAMRTKINSLQLSFEELFTLSSKYDKECLTPEQKALAKEKSEKRAESWKLFNIQQKLNNIERRQIFGY